MDTLVAVRVELPDVFEATHRLLLDLNRRGIIEGFRIDHPDGLADPEGYLRMLREAARPGTGIWVEKILEGQERLPDGWPCDGTTGYDALSAVTAALTDPTTAPVLTEAWVRAGGDPDLHAVELAAKRQVVDELLGPEVQRLTRRACEALPGLEPDAVRQAVVELLVSGEVYRAYLRPGAPLSDLARHRLDGALRVAVASRPGLEAVLREVATLLSGDRAPDFATRFQQTWGPVMAKGIEDTTFYRWHRFVALNEVGGDPLLLDDAAPEVMHAWAAHQQEHLPLGMTTLSTHDTKRSEDVRARLVALGGDGEAWERLTDAFVEAADAHGVDRPTGHLVWQTVAGVGPVAEERLHGYLDKALREGKQRTRWTDPDADYENRVRGLADASTRPGATKALLHTAMQEQADAVRCVVLGQKLLQLTLPGIPDTYQGCELVDLSLVDPDNRRPVDYPERARRLARLAAQPPADLDDEKLLVTSRALGLRKQEREAFGEQGGYTPLSSTSRHLVGFLRGRTVAVAATRAPQRLAAGGGWGAHTVALRDGTWRDVLSGALHAGRRRRLRGALRGLPGRPAAEGRGMMRELTVWAPYVDSVDLAAAGRPAPDDPRRRPAPGGSRSTCLRTPGTPSRWTVASRSRTPVGCGFPTVRTAGRSSTTRATSCGPTADGPGCR